MANDWAHDEIDAVLDAYLAMLWQELQGQPYVKAEYNRKVQAAIGRTRGSVEFKFQNVSAALRDLGLAWIPGFKPKANYQDEVRRQLQDRRRAGELGFGSPPRRASRG